METLAASSEELGTRRAGRRLLRPGAPARAVGPPVDARSRAGRPGPPAARGDGAGRLHAVRGRRRPTQGELEIGVQRAALARETPGCPRSRTAARGSSSSSSARRSRPGCAAGGAASGARGLLPASSAGRRSTTAAKRQFPGAAVHPAPLALAPADHRGRAGVRLPGQLDPRADLRRRGRATASCSTPATPDAEGTLGGLVEAAGGSTSTSARPWRWASSARTTRSAPSTIRENANERRFLPARPATAAC